MARNIKLTIEYDGTNFHGWQTQTARSSSQKRAGRRMHRTIQEEIEKALKKIFKRNLKVIGSGRTDSGVHAWGQVAHFKSRSSMSVTEMRNALNANLPDDIAILKIEEVPLNFHAQYSVKSKTYRYTILNTPTRCAQQRHFCLYYPYQLNIRRMKEEAKDLIGRKNFKSFTASNPAKRKAKKIENTIRTIKRLSITKKGDNIIFDIEANGFLYKMVRNIIGTLLEVGRGKLAKGSIKQFLSEKNRRSAGNTAKPKGLALLEVRY